MGALTHNGDVITGLPSIASQINYDNTSSGMAATQVQDAVDELNSNKQPKTDNNLQTTSKETTGAINELKSGLIVYFDSDELTFTDIANNANQNQIVTNFNVPSGYTVITRDVLVTNITESWNILVSFLNRYNSVSVHNYGTNANKVKVVVRSLCVKSGG